MSLQRKTHAYSAHRAPVPRWRAELPFALLVGSALAAPLAVLDQGGDWHTAILAGCVVLGAPGAAVESMVGVARFAHLLKGEER